MQWVTDTTNEPSWRPFPPPFQWLAAYIAEEGPRPAFPSSYQSAAA
jgi:hypothetical protein